MIDRLFVEALDLDSALSLGPWELHNLASDRAEHAVMTTLRRRLLELYATPPHTTAT